MTQIVDFKLSEHYSFFDLTDSNEHPELVEENRQYAEQVSDGSIRIMNNLELLCTDILEKVYEECGEVPQVLSGLRFGRLNRAVGGAWNSLHKKGMAVDFTLYNTSIWDLFRRIYEYDIFGFHKLIYYKGQYFIHASLPTGSGDGKVLVKDKGKFKVMR